MLKFVKLCCCWIVIVCVKFILLIIFSSDVVVMVCLGFFFLFFLFFGFVVEGVYFLIGFLLKMIEFCDGVGIFFWLLV